MGRFGKNIRTTRAIVRLQRLASRSAMLLMGFATAVAAQTGTPTLSVGNGSVIEGNSGTRALNIPLTRTGASTEAIAVQYRTNASPSNPATAGSDYVSITSGNALLPAGSNTINLPVTINGDILQEPDENFLLHLTGAHNVGPAPSFVGQVTFATQASPQSVVSADFNGDGRPDLATANRDSDSISVALNTTSPGATTFTYASAQNFSAGDGPVYLSVGDFNGDGRPDLASANQDSDSISVLLNQTAPGAATASFTLQQGFATENYPQSVAVADVNGDGRPDLAAANFGATVSVLLNTTAPGAGTPSFASQQSFTIGSLARSLGFGDVNGDGRPDLAVTDQSAGTVVLLLNTTAPGAATPSFASPQGFATGAVPRSVAFSDINGDGRPDLAVVSTTTNIVSVLLNTTAPGAAAPGFAARQDFPTGTGPIFVIASDVNGDGRPDLAVANNSAGTLVSVLLNTTPAGAGTVGFAAQLPFTNSNGSLPTSISASDINGDGLPELAVASRGLSNSVSVLLNTTTPARPAPTFSGGTAVATGAEPLDTIAADFNLDGRPDVATINVFDNSVSVLLNDTAAGAAVGSFSAAVRLPTGTSPSDLASADLNLDGRPDLVTANNASSTVSVLINTTPPGAGIATFAGASTLGSGLGTRAVALGDVNGDGRPDLAISVLDGTVRVHLNTTNPGAAAASFQATPLVIAGLSNLEVAMADLDLDGRLDLAVSSLDNRLTLLHNQTAPGATTASFAPAVVIPMSADGYDLALADLNGDGRPDVATAGNPVLVRLNTTPAGSSAFTFGAETALPVFPGDQGRSVRIGDVNGDGRPDLALGTSASNGGGEARVFANTTPPGAAVASFAEPVVRADGRTVEGVALADFNGDGRADLAASDRNASELAVFINQLYPAAIATNEATGTIIDDDTPRTLSINDVTRAEGDSGTTAFTFTVSLSAPAGAGGVSLSIATADGTATTADNDYTARSLTAQTIPAGSSTYTFTVTVNGDTRVEANETFFVNVFNVTGATVVDNQGLGTLTNDDVADITPDAFTFIDQTGVQRNTLRTGNAVTITGINAPSPFSVTGGFASLNGGPCTLTSGSVSANGTLALCHSASASFDTDTNTVLTIGADGVLVGVSDTFTSRTEIAPRISVTPAASSVTEGNSGIQTVTLTATLAQAAKETVTVNYSSADGTATTADGDYAASSGALTFDAGVTSQTFTVTVNGDSKVEPDERFTVVLSNPTPTEAQIVGGSSAITISNDDAATLSIDDVTLAEGDSGSTAFTFNVALSNASASPVTVNYATANGSATAADGDYLANSGSLTFNAGETSMSVTVQVTGDTKVEPNETFTVVLSGASGATIADASGQGTISNDDAATLSINDVILAEGNAGSTAFNFTVSLSNPSANTVRVNYATASGSATTADNDYDLTAGAVEFSPGVTRQTLTVQVRGDTRVEPNETFTVLLSDPEEASIVDASGLGTITNDDAADTTPDAFAFFDRTDVEPGSIQTSNAITVTGINVATPFTVTGGFASVNGGNCILTGGMVAASDTVSVCHTASSAAGAVTNTVLDIGGVSDTYTSTTRAAVVIDVVPDPFGFASEALISTNSRRTSKAIVITGYAAPTTISVSAGSQYSIGCKEATITAAPGMISPGQSVCVRHMSSPDLGKTVTTTLTVGGVDGTYSTTTNPPDSRPNNFSFPTTTGVAVNSVNTSSPITVGGINTASPISVSAGSFYSIGSGPFVDTPGTVLNGNTVRVRTTASNRRNISVVATLTIGGINGLYRVTTAK